MTCRRLSRVSWLSGERAIRAAPRAPWTAPAKISQRVRLVRRASLVSRARAIKKNSRLARSLPKRRISSGGTGVETPPATKAAPAMRTKATSAWPAGPTGKCQRLKATLPMTAEKVAMRVASTKVSWAPARGMGMTPEGTIATIATKKAMPRIGRAQIAPISTTAAMAAAGTSGEVAAVRIPTAMAAAQAMVSIDQLVRSRVTAVRITGQEYRFPAFRGIRGGNRFAAVGGHAARRPPLRGSLASDKTHLKGNGNEDHYRVRRSFVPNGW